MRIWREAGRVAVALLVALTLAAGRLAATAAQGTGEEGSTISADFPCESHYVEVLGSRMHYVDGIIDVLGLEDLTLVVQDWGSVLGFHYIQEDRPEFIGRTLADWRRRIDQE